MVSSYRTWFVTSRLSQLIMPSSWKHFLCLASRILFWFTENVLIISRKLFYIFYLLDWLLIPSLLCCFLFMLLYLYALSMTPQIMGLLFCFVSPILDLLVISASSMVWKATYMLRMPTFTFLALDTPLHSRQLLTSSIWMCHSLN